MTTAPTADAPRRPPTRYPIPDTRLLAPIAAALLAYALAPTFLVFTNDTYNYLRHAGYPTSALLGLTAPPGPIDRPFGYPLLLQLLGVHDASAPLPWRALARANALLAAVAVFFAAAAGRHLFRWPAARLAWAVLVLAFALSEFVWVWQAVAVTEFYGNLALLASLAAVTALAIPRRPQTLDPRPYVLAAAAAWLAVSMRYALLTVPAGILAGLGVAWLHGRRIAKSRKAVYEHEHGKALSRTPNPEPRPPPTPRSLLPSLACAAATAAALAWAGWSFTRTTSFADLYASDFVTLRLLPAKGGPAALRARFPPTPAVLAGAGQPWWDNGWDKDPERMAWARTYRQRHHFPLLATNPRLALRILRDTATTVTKDVGSDRMAWWYLDYFSKLSPDKKGFEPGEVHLANRLACAPLILLRQVHPLVPLLLPAALALALLVRPVSLRRVPAAPAAVLLAVNFYGQFLATAYGEAIEDNRHATTGSLALALACWLAPTVLIAGRRRRAEFWVLDSSSDADSVLSVFFRGH